jgi:uncharacterized protein
MALYFLDSSALVKRYISETGSTWILGLFAPALKNEIFIAAIAKVEIVAAIMRRSRSGSISVTEAKAIVHQLRKDSRKGYQVIEITESIINSGMALAETYGLRGYDAIQLAAGRAVNILCLASGLPPITFVSADNELNAAVISEGLLMENPNNYSP